MISGFDGVYDLYQDILCFNNKCKITDVWSAQWIYQDN
jgi:hypothetical protein